MDNVSPSADTAGSDMCTSPAPAADSGDAGQPAAASAPAPDSASADQSTTGDSSASSANPQASPPATQAADQTGGGSSSFDAGGGGSSWDNAGDATAGSGSGNVSPPSSDATSAGQTPAPALAPDPANADQAANASNSTSPTDAQGAGPPASQSADQSDSMCSLPDTHLDWAHQFCGIDPRAASQSTDGGDVSASGDTTLPGVTPSATGYAGAGIDPREYGGQSSEIVNGTSDSGASAEALRPSAVPNVSQLPSNEASSITDIIAPALPNSGILDGPGIMDDIANTAGKAVSTIGQGLAAVGEAVATGAVEVATGAVAVGLAVGAAVLTWPRSTAPRWMDEMNPDTGESFRDDEEFEERNRKRPRNKPGPPTDEVFPEDGEGDSIKDRENTNDGENGSISDADKEKIVDLVKRLGKVDDLEVTDKEAQDVGEVVQQSHRGPHPHYEEGDPRLMDRVRDVRGGEKIGRSLRDHRMGR